jgi:predicted NAD/FAD-dependent oxidoreductase
MPTQTPVSCTIVGAGISGLLAASVLQKKGVDVRVLEKARGVGGRMSTRRMDGARVDHGAQYFTVRENVFAGWVEVWEHLGVVREWFRRFPAESSEAGHPRYRGHNGMNAVCKHLAQNVSVELNTKVESMSFSGGRWRVVAEGGKEFASDFLVLTVPVPQALPLIDTAGIRFSATERQALEKIDYERSLAVLAILERPSAIKDFGGMKLGDGPITWIADNQKKGISEAPAVTIHSDHDYAVEHWDSPDEIRIPPLLEAAGGLLGSKVLESSCHRWRYTRPIEPFNGPYLFSREANLMLCGDSFGGPRVEGAAMSGIEAAAHLTDFL